MSTGERSTEDKQFSAFENFVDGFSALPLEEFLKFFDLPERPDRPNGEYVFFIGGEWVEIADPEGQMPPESPNLGAFAAKLREMEAEEEQELNELHAKRREKLLEKAIKSRLILVRNGWVYPWRMSFIVPLDGVPISAFEEFLQRCSPGYDAAQLKREMFAGLAIWQRDGYLRIRDGKIIAIDCPLRLTPDAVACGDPCQ